MRHWANKRLSASIYLGHRNMICDMSLLIVTPSTSISSWLCNMLSPSLKPTVVSVGLLGRDININWVLSGIQVICQRLLPAVSLKWLTVKWWLTLLEYTAFWLQQDACWRIGCWLLHKESFRADILGWDGVSYHQLLQDSVIKQQHPRFILNQKNPAMSAILK